IIGIMLTFSSALTFAPRVRQPQLTRRRSGWLSLLALPIGVETGFSSAGAGALGTVLLLNYSELSAATVVGTDLVLGIVLAVVGSLFHLSWGSINSASLLRLLMGGIPGVLIGCAFAKRVPGQKLRMVVATVAIVLGLQLIWIGGSPLLRAHAAASESVAGKNSPSSETATSKPRTISRALLTSYPVMPVLEPFYSLPFSVAFSQHCCR
ncbi:MAG TPA: sulfite exporter TauE/SafE family protein, partial [Terriglobales bacterium]|nr:sulfite exporter TauE/SafE family protein [Terriglobales bacterium]